MPTALASMVLHAHGVSRQGHPAEGLLAGTLRGCGCGASLG